MTTKVCTKCGIEKPIDEFYFYTKKHEKRQAQCKTCVNEKNRVARGSEKLSKQLVCPVCKTYFIRKAHNQIYCSVNCRKIALVEYNKKYHAEYYKHNGEYVRQKVKQYRQDNPEKYREQKRAQYKKHKDSINKRLRAYKKRRNKEDLNYRMRVVFSRRIQVAVTRQCTGKADKTEQLLGCSVKEAVKHLEKQFQKGMSWDNYGHHGWHIDHRVPCNNFNLTDPEQQKACFHFTNLQPLWAKDNIKKSDKVIYLL